MINLKDKGLRYQAQLIFDRAARAASNDTTHTSRPDAMPMWDDLTEDDQEMVMVEYDESGVLHEYPDTGVPWHGSDDAMIESQTNPWLENDEGPINLEVLVGTFGGKQGDCDDCGELLAGVLNMDDPYGIQRCDTCRVYPGDLDAARALRDRHFPTATIWFHGTN